LLLLTLYAIVHPTVVLKANRKIRESWQRRFGSLLYNLECRALFDLSNWDVNGTPKIFPRTFTKLLHLTRDDDLIDAEFDAICRREGYPMIEVPIFSTRRHGGRSTTGYRSALQNIGQTRNTGLELALSTVNLQNWHGLTWTSDVNWAHNHNEIVKLATSDTTGCPVNARPCDLNNGWFVGQPINLNSDAQRRVWYDYRMIGIWQIPDSALARSFGSQFKPGEIRLLDVNGDGRITSADRIILGNSYPKWTASLYNRLTWKAVDLSALATWRWGYTLFDDFGTNTNSMQGRLGNIVTEYWTPERPSYTQPAPRLNGNVVPYSSTRGYLNGSHWRIRNVTLGYQVPGRLLQRVGADRMRVYATAQDPFFFSSYRGYDPENGTSGGAPSYRTLVVGANLAW
jgi:hypothetical protein